MRLVNTLFSIQSGYSFSSVRQFVLAVMGIIVFIPVLVFSANIPALNQPCFIENKGQFSPEVQYVAFTPTCDIWITKTKIIQDFHSEINPPISMEICSVKVLTVQPTDILSGQLNYFNRATPSVGVRRFGSLLMPDVSDGIDMRWYFDNGQPRYDFIVKSGAKPSNAFITFRGVKGITVNPSGELCFDSETKENRRHQGLLAYQMVDNCKKIIPCKFSLVRNSTDEQTVGFNLDEYDESLPLVVDPVIMGSFFGGSGMDRINDIKLDDLGNIYVAGVTNIPSDLPTGATKYPNNNSGVGPNDGFVAKFTADGDKLVYYCIIGGNQTDDLVSLVLDKSGSVYVGGTTNSTKAGGFPLTSNALDSVLGEDGASSGFIAQFTNEGSTLEFCTYIGKENVEKITEITYDEDAEAIYVVGSTNDKNTLPFSKNPSNREEDAFYQAINIPGKRILYSGYIGGANNDIATSLTVTGGKVVIVGYTNSADIVGSNNEWRGGNDGFITTINKETGEITSFRYFGGKGDDVINGVTSDTLGKVTVCGTTNSSELPYTKHSFATSLIGNNDGFIAQFEKLDSLVFSSYIGGSKDEELFDVKVDDYGQIYAFGNTGGEITTPQIPKDADFPRPFDVSRSDCFWVMVNPKDEMLNYVTYLGGSGPDFARAIAVFQDHIYCAGFTLSNDFQPMGGGSSFTPNNRGGFDGFFCSQDLPIHSPSIYPSTIDFGRVLINTSGKKDSIIVRNRTSRPIQFKIPSTLKMPFTLKHSFTVFTLNPLESTVIYANFIPTTPKLDSSILPLEFGKMGAFEVKLIGEGISPTFMMLPEVVAFGQREIDSSVVRKVVISNVGTAAGRIRFLQFDNNSAFNYQYNQLPKDTILKVGESTEIFIEFKPATEGEFLANFIVEGENENARISLKGEGIAPHFSWTTDYSNLGNVRLGKSRTGTVVLKNTGKANGKVSLFQLKGNNAFTLMPVIFPKDSTVKPNDSIECTFTFLPSVRSQVFDTIVAYTQLGTIEYPVLGLGVYPVVTQLSPPQFEYGNTPLGVSKYDVIRLANYGDDIDSVHFAYLSSFSGETNFELIPIPEKLVISPESPIEISVVFNPKSTGIKTDTAVIICGSKIIKTVLVGHAVTPQFDLPDSISFGGRLIGSTVSQTIYIKNIGTDTGRIGEIKIVGDPNMNFILDPNAPQNTNLAPEESSPIIIKFAPKFLGMIEGASLQIKAGDDEMIVKLRAETFGAIFKPQYENIEFKPTNIGSSRDSFFLIKNIGNISGSPKISIIQGNDLGDFSRIRIDDDTTIHANDDIKVYYRFTPRTAGPKSAYIQVSGNPIEPESFTLRFYGRGVATETKTKLSLPNSITAKIGDKISLPIVVSEIDGRNMDSVRSVHCLVRYNSTVLGVEYPFTDSLTVMGDSVAVLSLQRATTDNGIKEGDTLLSFQFTVGLGNAPFTEVVIERLDWKSKSGSLLPIVSGTLPKTSVQVSDIIEIKGKQRLYDKGQLPLMTLKANTIHKTPLSIHIEGAAHCTSLIIYDERGRVVADMTQLLLSGKKDFEYDSSALSKGMYYCVLLAGTTPIVRDFVIE